ncbi:hypothetical protein [Streptomyces sp. NPDC001927]
MQTPHGWVVDVPAAELADLAGSPDSVRRLRARRGYLGATPANSALAEILRTAPEEFGRVGCVVLGADVVQLSADGADLRGFGGTLRVYGVECIDGFQRLKIVADAVAARDKECVEPSTLRLEIHCGPSRDVVRRLHHTGNDPVNASTAQDALIRCPNIVRLMNADWEGTGSFHPWRGAVAGPHGRLFTMPVVTRALACLAPGPLPEAAYLASTGEGLQKLWSAVGSPLYLSLFHDSLSPLGVLRAVEAWSGAREVLDAMPGRRKEGPGHLIPYAPDLICWAACQEIFPPAELHDEKSAFEWNATIRDLLPAVTARKADDFVRRYGALRKARGSRGNYAGEADRFDVWVDVLSLQG